MRISRFVIPACFMYVCAVPFVPDKYWGKIPDFEPEPYDSTKANLPMIYHGDIWSLATVVKYRTEDNEIKEVKASPYTSDCSRMLALYEAIRKYSSEKEPNIVNTRAFYDEVIRKRAASSQNGVDVKSFLNPFNKLYKAATKEDSPGGKNITPSEYTKMMSMQPEPENNPGSEHHPAIIYRPPLIF